MDPFLELKAFVEIVEAESLSSAADRLNVTKSVLSRRLKALEERLDTQLLVRTTRRQSLTETGAAFYERSLAVLAELEAAEDSVTEADSALRGRLRIAAPQSYGLTHVTPPVIEFMQQYPNVLIDLDLNDRLVDMTREGFDMAIRVGALNDSTLRARRIGRVRMVVCASPDYFERFGVPGTPDDLKRHQCLRLNQLANLNTWHYRNREKKLGTVRVPIRALSSSGDFMREAAIAGLGIVLVPTFLIEQALRAGTLVTVLDEYEWYETAPEPSVYAVFPPSQHRTRRVRVFANFLAERLQA
ncbi:MAG TPA: LysR family transcriptional regulator [Salinisphaeraceae bacterium]|nr:LysR family transcriptional regulator [Salinisphaeraceae bacterium]